MLQYDARYGERERERSTNKVKPYKNNWGPECNHHTNIVLCCKSNEHIIEPFFFLNETNILNARHIFMTITTRKKLMPLESSYLNLHYGFCWTH
jgi:hypothetical protein